MPSVNNGIWVPKFLVPILLILLASIFGVGYKAYSSISRADVLQSFVTTERHNGDMNLIRNELGNINDKLDRLIERGR